MRAGVHALNKQGEPEDSPTQSSTQDFNELLARINQLESAQRAREERIALLSEENHPDQRRLIFNEAEVLASEPAGETNPVQVPAHERKKRGRQPLPSHPMRSLLIRCVNARGAYAPGCILDVHRLGGFVIVQREGEYHLIENRR